MSKETTTTLAPPPSSNASLLTDQDIHLFNEGTHYRIYDKLGAHITTVAGKARNILQCVGAQRECGFSHRRLQWMGPAIAQLPSSR